MAQPVADSVVNRRPAGQPSDATSVPPTAVLEPLTQAGASVADLGLSLGLATISACASLTVSLGRATANTVTSSLSATPQNASPVTGAAEAVKVVSKAVEATAEGARTARGQLQLVTRRAKADAAFGTSVDLKASLVEAFRDASVAAFGSDSDKVARSREQRRRRLKAALDSLPRLARSMAQLAFETSVLSLESAALRHAEALARRVEALPHLIQRELVALPAMLREEVKAHFHAHLTGTVHDARASLVRARHRRDALRAELRHGKQRIGAHFGDD